MQIHVAKNGKHAVITLSGRLDMNTSPDLRKTALALYNKGRSRSLTIDFTEVAFIDTSGLATLLDILVAAREQSAQLTLSGLNQAIRYLIDVNGLMAFFTIGSSVEERLHA